MGLLLLFLLLLVTLLVVCYYLPLLSFTVEAITVFWVTTAFVRGEEKQTKAKKYRRCCRPSWTLVVFLLLVVFVGQECHAWLYSLNNNKNCYNFKLWSTTFGARGKGTAYDVESFAERHYQKLLWENGDDNAFLTAQMVVNRTLLLRKDNANNTATSASLLLVSTQEATSPQEMFAPLMYHLNSFMEINDITGICQVPNNKKEEESNESNTFRRPAFPIKIQSFAIVLAYRGIDFCGWQAQPGRQRNNDNGNKPSVQECIEQALCDLEEKERIIVKSDSPNNNNNKTNKIKKVVVCGRTDAGVNAIGQVCRYRTRFIHITSDMIANHLNTHFQQQQQQQPTTTSLACLGVQPVSLDFHPSFGATCRAYAYLLDWPSSFAIMSADLISQRLNALFQPIVNNNTLSFVALSYGKIMTETTNCTLSWARATTLSYSDATTKRRRDCLMIQFVGNRFLRRMVRYLVSVALLLALDKDYYYGRDCVDDGTTQNNEEEDSRLLDLILQKDRNAIMAPPAPPQGLIFVNAAFSRI